MRHHKVYGFGVLQKTKFRNGGFKMKGLIFNAVISSTSNSNIANNTKINDISKILDYKKLFVLRSCLSHQADLLIQTITNILFLRNLNWQD